MNTLRTKLRLTVIARGIDTDAFMLDASLVDGKETLPAVPSAWINISVRHDCEAHAWLVASQGKDFYVDLSPAGDDIIASHDRRRANLMQADSIPSHHPL